MGVIEEIVNLTNQEYGVDVSNNLVIKQQGLKFYSNDYFDWFAEGIIIYLPDFEGEEGIDYVLIGVSSLFEYEHPDQPADLYIRKDYDQVLSKYYPDYCIIDQEEGNSQPDQYIYTSFLLMQDQCQ